MRTAGLYETEFVATPNEDAATRRVKKSESAPEDDIASTILRGVAEGNPAAKLMLKLGVR